MTTKLNSATNLLKLSLLSTIIASTGCATVGANLALHLAKEEEAKGCSASYPGDNAKVTLDDCERISRLIKKAGVPGGFVGYDQSGRIKLKGSYINEEQIDLAYMTALTVVGASSMDISPITPRDLQEIKMVKSYMPQKISKEKGEKYALLIGVSKFQQPGLHPIETAVKDIESVKDVLKKSGGFKEENIILIRDEQATRFNILKELKDLKEKTTPRDSVVFYISTHGTPPDTFGKMGIIPFDIKSEVKSENVQAEANKIQKDESGDEKIIKIVKDRVNSLKTAISFDDVQDFITGIKTDKLVAIIDTCYSGSALGALSYPVGGDIYVEREKNYTQSLNSANKSELIGSGKQCTKSEYSESANLGIKTHDQLTTNNQCKNTVGSKGLFLTDSTDESSQKKSNKNSQLTNNANYDFDILEQFRLAFNNSNVRQQNGKIIITAASGDEKSRFDPKQVPTSYFTYYLTKGLQKSHGQIYPAFDYAKIRTRKIVSESLENCSQTPEMTSTPDECTNLDLSK